MEKAEQLLALAIDKGASAEEQRTAAHALCKLIQKHGLSIVEGAPSSWPDIRHTADPPAARAARGRPPRAGSGWSSYVAEGYVWCTGCGGNIERGSTFHTHPRIGLRCSRCTRIHGGP